MFGKIKKIKNIKDPINRQMGMTYIELIVVLSIFSVMTAIVLTNYGAFQAKVDIKNLANDIALKIIGAQKAAMSGQLTTFLPSVNPWKPAYGVSFVSSTNFVYFVDLNNDGYYNNPIPGPTSCGGECIENITITRGDSISRMDGCATSSSCVGELMSGNFSIVFKRPDTSSIVSVGVNGSGSIYNTNPSNTFDHFRITVASPHSTSTGRIEIYPSGRIQID